MKIKIDQSKFDSAVLDLVSELEPYGYAVSIRQRLSERLCGDVSLFAVYDALNRLEALNHISSWLGDPTPERGNREKRMYRIVQEDAA